MGIRGPRSAMDQMTTGANLSSTALKRVDIAATAKTNGTTQREVVRALRRAARIGNAECHQLPDGREEWFWRG